MNRSRKIIIIGPAYPLRGGPALLNENLCSELLKAGHAAQIVSFSFQYPSFLFPGTTQFDISRGKPSCTIHPLIHTLYPLSWIKTARFILNQKPDFVLIRYWLPYFAPSLGTIARSISRHTHVLALVDNLIPHEKRAGDKVLTRYFIHPLHGLVCMSAKVEEDIKKFFPKKPFVRIFHPLYEVYPPPVSRQEARNFLHLPTDKTILLFFGLIRKYKGLHLLLEAMSLLKNPSQNILLLVAGDFYEPRQEYEPLLSELIQDGKVILHDGFIPDNLLHYYFCAANVCVQPYLNATNSGITMVSYFYNTPVIATRVGGLPEIIPHGQCGLLAEPDAHSLSQTIRHFLDSSCEDSFRKNIQSFKKNFSWENFIDRIIKFHEDLLSGK